MEKLYADIQLQSVELVGKILLAIIIFHLALQNKLFLTAIIYIWPIFWQL